MKSLRDSHVDIFDEITIKESIVDIKLLQVPIFYGSNGYNNMDGGHFNNKRENLQIINALNLGVAFAY